jgi:hypothetical protein
MKIALVLASARSQAINATRNLAAFAEKERSPSLSYRFATKKNMLGHDQIGKRSDNGQRRAPGPRPSRAIYQGELRGALSLADGART